MEDSRLDQLIIDMMRSGVSRSDSIRSLVRQGYDAQHIQDRLNELYYAGALTPNASDTLERSGVHKIQDSVSEKQSKEIPRVSRWKKIIIWTQLYPFKAIVWLLVTLLLTGSGVGGYIGYARAPLTVMQNKAQELSQLPLVAFTITKQASINDATAYTIEGVMSASGQESITTSFFVPGEEKKWDIQVVRGVDDTVYMRLIEGPSPYSFIYNKWISINSDGAKIETISELGLENLYDYIYIPKIVWSQFSLSDSYQSILVQPKTSSCSSVYSILFSASSEELKSFSYKPLEYIQSLFVKSLWDVCVSPRQGILSARSNDFSVTLFIPTATPSFTIDTQATPIETIGQWISEGNSNVK
jgi:hypothetical protein